MVDDYLKERPNKKILPKELQESILPNIKDFIGKHLPRSNIHLARIFGSIAKGTFGRYESLWKGRQYSDVDVVFVVDDNFVAPSKWKIHFIPETKFWVVYEIGKCVVSPGELSKAVSSDGSQKEPIIIDIQYLIVAKSFAQRPEVLAEAEKWGIPLANGTGRVFIGF